MPLQTEAINKIIAQLQEQAGIAGARTAGRQATIESIFDEIISRYGPEGTYGRSAEALLETQKVREVGAGAQRMISAGLYGTEVGGGLGRAWESEVGAPGRLRIEDIKMERLSQAQLGKAGFLERIEDVYPDYGLISQLISQAAAGPEAAPTAYGGAGVGAAGGARYGGGPFLWAGTAESKFPIGDTEVGEVSYGTTRGTPSPTAPTPTPTPTPTAGGGRVGWWSDPIRGTYYGTPGALSVAAPSPSEKGIIQERLKKKYPTVYGQTPTKQPTGFGELFQRGMGRMP